MEVYWSGCYFVSFLIVFLDGKVIIETEDNQLTPNTTVSEPELLISLRIDGPLNEQVELAPKSLIGYEVPCGIRRDQDRIRIVGGTNASPGEFPWQVSVQLVRARPPGSQHVCGGAVLSSSWVLTAGHCVDGLTLKQLSVVAGENDLHVEEGFEQRRSVVRIVKRTDIDVAHFINDLAMLQLDHPLRMGGLPVSPICLPDPTHKYITGEGIVAGWGRLSENGTRAHILQHVSLPFIPIADCHQRFTKLGYTDYIHPNQLCLGYDAGEKDSCQGDSGGPLACRHDDGRHYLCGLVSWGIGCARPTLPGIYTDIARYSHWIKSVLYNENNFLGRGGRMPE